ncbi:MAG: nicotinate-nucleotide--dimethylbenzimidazole phosphoribosyltransferase [Oscillospiraceae bacterium]|nr:nicotinate-nucleotide--dimethylbenzimidazole phosphoribosyltransferase [Oscillospiraceae bacterium]
MNLKETCQRIEPLNTFAMEQARHNWDSVAKPLHSLGKLEDLLVQIAGITGSAQIDLRRKAVVAFCADNGVVAEGVTQCGQEVTALVAESFARGTTPVCRMAQVAGADILPVDIGLCREVTEPGVLQRAVRRGTGNLAKEPAMSRAEAVQAIETGIELVRECKEKGYRLLATGEMGIGNTTTSSAVTAVLLGAPVEQVTGRGAGLSTAGLERKRAVISHAIELHQPDPNNSIDVLAKVGGLDLAGMVGLYLGGAVYHVPVVMDGFIAGAAALAAVRLCPAVREYLIPSHQSSEPAVKLLMEALGLSPILRAEMRLGEGTGAVALMPLLDMALAVYRDTPSFGEMNMEAYTEQV